MVRLLCSNRICVCDVELFELGNPGDFCASMNSSFSFGSCTSGIMVATSTLAIVYQHQLLLVSALQQ